LQNVPTEHPEHCLTGQGHSYERQTEATTCPMHIAQSSLLRRPCYNWCSYYCWRPICVPFSCHYWRSCCCWRPCFAGVPAVIGSLLLKASLLLLVSQLRFASLLLLASLQILLIIMLLRFPSWANISAVAGVPTFNGAHVVAAAGALTVACASTALVFCCRWLSIRC
jgi:hypothetical protein